MNEPPRPKTGPALATAPRATMTIQDVAARTGLSAHTLRYYERIGLLDPVGRTESGHRRYTDADLGWIELLGCLRETGMSIEQMQRFTDLGKPGRATATDRRALLETHQRLVRERIGDLERALGVIEGKITAYRGQEAAVERRGDPAAPT